MTKILCVAEKPSIAKAVSRILGGGQVNTVSSVHIEVEIEMEDLILTKIREKAEINSSKTTNSHSISADNGETVTV